MINKYNRIVPILSKQQNHIILEKKVMEIKNIIDNNDAINANISGNHINNSSENLNFNSNNYNSSDKSLNSFESKVKNEKNLFKKIFSLFS